MQVQFVLLQHLRVLKVHAGICDVNMIICLYAQGFPWTGLRLTARSPISVTRATKKSANDVSPMPLISCTSVLIFPPLAYSSSVVAHCIFGLIFLLFS